MREIMGNELNEMKEVMREVLLGKDCVSFGPRTLMVTTDMREFTGP